MKFTALLVVCLLCLGVSAFAYDFWGITLGTDTYQGSTQLAFTSPQNDEIQYVVGGYEYTRVGSNWYGPFAAASPGANYTVHRKMDAQGLFFLADVKSAKFVIFTGMPQTGVAAPECGYGTRLFGPGDLRIVTGGNSYGVGFRLDNLTWAVDPNTTSAYYKIHNPDGTDADIHCRDAGTLGTVEKNAKWAHVDHPELAPNAEAASAFYIKGTGTDMGNVNVTVEDTGVVLNGTRVYAYKVDVPWTMLDINGGNHTLRTTWGPDCGNDLLAGDFTVAGAIPEPATILGVSTALMGFVVYKRRKKS